MEHTKLHSEMLSAMANAVLRRVEEKIKAVRCDTSAVADSHKTGYEAGFRACKRALLDALTD